MSKIQEALNKIKSAEAASREARAGSIGADSGSIDANASKRVEKIEQQHGIQQMGEPTKRPAHELATLKLLDAEMVDTHFLNAFRELRTTMLRTLKQNESLILVTSTSRGAGSTFVSLNLAAAFALDEGKTSLVVDCDLRRPYLDKIIAGNGDVKGLRDYLTSQDVSIPDIIHPSGVPRMRLLPAGSDQAAIGEYFTSAKLGTLMAELRMRYPERYIIVDSPPVSESADARMLADLCDYAILVVPYGRTTEAQIDASIEAIGEEKLLGVIFNNTPCFPRLGW